ncbi:MAG: hypoxanthine phosphoribosyltransferase [Chlorobi bacterium]|nr:hypoxanthine phosphoribosyltransferase [Chlorobiota bacterium]
MEIQILDKRFVRYIPHGEILAKVEELARRVHADAAGADEIPVFVVVLKGGMIFAADFAKAYPGEMILDYMRVKSYEGTGSTGKVRLLIPPSENLEGRPVYLLEDIVDTGNTLAFLVDELKKHRPAFVKIVTLFYKPEAYKKDLPVDFAGMEIPNKFIVGYGLDYNELGRNLKDVYQLKK